LGLPKTAENCYKAAEISGFFIPLKSM
jgi:hypothetical protein